MTGTETPTSPTPAATPAPPVAPPAPLADQYEVGDGGSASYPTVPAMPAADGPAPGTPAPPAPGSPTPRDPDTGRFVKGKHPRYLAQLAAEMGMTAEQIADADPEMLSQHVYLLRQRESSVAQTMQEGLDRQGQAPAAPPAPPGAPPADGPPQGESAANEFELPADLADFHPYLQQMGKAVKGLLAAKKAMEEQLGQVREHVQGQVRQTVTQRCDKAFTKHKDFLGDGGRGDFQAGDPMLARRQAVLQLAQTMKGGTLESNIDAAVGLLYGPLKAGAAAAPAKPAVSAEDWRQAALGRPTHRNGAAEPPSEEKARQTVARFLDEHQSPPADHTLADEFPG